MNKQQMFESADLHEKLAITYVVTKDTARAAAHFIVAEGLRRVAQRDLTSGDPDGHTSL